MKRMRGFALISFALVVALIAGSGCKPKKKDKFFVPTEKVVGSATIGTGGGALNINDPTSPINGAGVSFPPGTFGQDSKIKISIYLGNIAPPPGMQLASEIIKVTSSTPPSGSFTIILPYNDENNDGLEDETGCPEVLLMPYWYDDAARSWVSIPKVSQDIDANTVTATWDKMGKFALFGPIIDTNVQPQLATNPIPADGLGNVDVIVTLGWDFPANTTSFDLYFGADRTAVETATTGSSEFRGNITTNYFGLPALSWFTSYYWRVDSVNDAGKSKMATPWSFRTRLPDPPAAVTNPNPPNGTQDVSLTQTLSWSPSADADSYDVYMGTSQAAVAAAGTASPEYQDNVTSPIFTQPGPLAQGTTYYWRIDAVNLGGATPSAVWSFQTLQQLADQASNPSPTNGATGQPLDITLSWDNAYLADTYDVYFGTDFTDVQTDDLGNTNNTYMGNTSGVTNWTPPAFLGEDTTYYWRIDTVNSYGTTGGLVWQFTTGQLPAIATVIDPPDTGPDEEVDQTLVWAVALGATSYDVYFGDNMAEVDAATTATPVIYRGEVFTNSWTTATLAEDLSYYWRIDSKNNVGTVKGVTWSFRTGLLPQAADTPVPADGAVGQATSLALSWNAVAATSHVYLGDNQALVVSGDPSVYLGNTAGTTMASGTLNSFSSYYWRVDTENAIGRVSGTVWEFSTANYPPAAVISAPLNGSVVTTPSQALSWSCGGAITDSFDVYFGANLSNVQSEDTGNSTGTFMGNQPGTNYAPAGLLPGMTYYWRIDSRNLVGATPGDVYVFTTIALPPQAVTPGPAHQVTDLNTLLPTLTWGCGGDVTTQFRVYFGDNQTQVASGDVLAYQGIYGVTNYSPAVLSASTSYYWRIAAENDFGNTAGLVWEFRVTDPPPAATIVAPADATPALDTPDASLQWDCGGAITDQFYLYFGDNQTLVDGEDNSVLSYTGTNIQWTTFTLSADTSYYWRVVAENGVDNSSAVTWSFKTEPMPAQAALVAPPDTGQTGPSVTLDWDCGGAYTDSFDVYFGDNSTEVLNDNSSNIFGTFKGNQTTSDYPTVPLTVGVTYYWRIDPVGNFGTTAGAVWSFTVIALPPKAVSPAPGNNALVTTPSQQLDWQCGGAVTDTFSVYFGTDYATVLGETTANTSNVYFGNQSGTTFDPGGLAPDTSYFWRIDTVNGLGTTKGDVWALSTIALPPQVTTPYPADLETDLNTLSPNMTWNCGGDVTTQFRVYFGDNQTQVASGDALAYQGIYAVTNYSPVALSASTSYYWRIDAENNFGNTAGTVWEFRVTDPPAAATMLSPSDTSMVDTPAPTIQWDCGGAITDFFELYFSATQNDVDTFNSSVLEYAGTSKFWLASPDLPADTSYYWRVKAINGIDNNNGVTWSFRTEPIPPAPILQTPADANPWVSVTTVNLDWDCGGAYTLGFNVFFGDNQTEVLNEDLTNSTGTYQGWLVTTAYDTDTLSLGVTYYWKIEATGNFGNSTSTVWSFRVTPLPPLAVTPDPG
ncbi:MAG: hypothetical protein E3J72_19735, partial [Planctomycetota bacterium]